MGVHRISDKVERRLRAWLYEKMKKEGYSRDYSFSEAVDELLDEVRFPNAH